MYTCTPSPCHLGQQAGGQVGLLGGEVEADEMAHETYCLSDTTQSMHGTAIWITSGSTENLKEHSHSTSTKELQWHNISTTKVFITQHIFYLTQTLEMLYHCNSFVLVLRECLLSLLMTQLDSVLSLSPRYVYE